MVLQRPEEKIVLLFSGKGSVAGNRTNESIQQVTIVGNCTPRARTFPIAIHFGYGCSLLLR